METKVTTAIEKLETFLNKHYEFRYNTLENRIVFKLVEGEKFEQLDDYSLNSILRSLKKAKFKIALQDLSQLLASDFVKAYNPLDQYFKRLPEWNVNMPDYIAQLAQTVTVSDEITDRWNNYLRKWLIATVACALYPEHVNQTVLVFVGNQGLGKTKWMDRLVPSKLASYYFSGTINPGDKDTKINLSECFLINLDELENLNKSKLGTLKQLITESSIRLRRPYGHNAEKMPRRASFMGSVNNTEFLRDDTGNRRFLCVETSAINYEHTVDMNCVYAQAYALYQMRERYWFTYEENCAISEYNERFKAQYFEIEIVNKYYEPCMDGEPDKLLSIDGLLRDLASKGHKSHDLNQTSLGKAMMASPFKKTRTKKDGRWLYRLKVRPKEQA